MKRKLLFAFLLILILSGCHALPEASELEWVKVNNPPGYTGSCYAYFISKGILDQKHSYSGVTCNESVNYDPIEVELEWVQIESPPNSFEVCHAYFIKEGIGEQQHASSGSWCY